VPGSDFEVIARILIVGLLIASVLVVVGLLAHKEWAWALAIVSSGLILAINLGWWWAGEPRYGSMLLNTVAVLYLNQRDVRLSLRGMVATS
jgi:urea transporter